LSLYHVLIELLDVLLDVLDMAIYLCCVLFDHKTAVIQKDILDHRDDREHQDALEVIKYPDSVLNRREDQVEPLVEVDGDQNNRDSQSHPRWRRCLIYPEGAVGHDDEKETGDTVVSDVESRVSLESQAVPDLGVDVVVEGVFGCGSVGVGHSQRETEKLLWLLKKDLGVTIRIEFVASFVEHLPSYIFQLHLFNWVIDHSDGHRALLLIVGKLGKVKLTVPDSVAGLLDFHRAIWGKGNDLLDSFMLDLSEKLDIRSPEIVEVICHIDLVGPYSFREPFKLIKSEPRIVPRVDQLLNSRDIS
jgi:hypothetical protein